MNLFEIICSVFVLSLFVVSLPDILIPASVSLERIAAGESDIKTVLFLSESFRRAAENNDTESWKKNCAPFADSFSICVQKEKDTAVLYKAECTVSGKSFVFYGAVAK